MEKTINKIPVFEIKGVEESSERKANDAIILLMFEYIILNLDQLVEAHPIVVKEIKKAGFLTLEKALNKLWKPIQNNEKKIIQWRNQYVAHSERRTKEYISTKDIDKDYFETQKEILKLARLATFYISGIFENFENDYKEAMKIHQKIVSKLKPSHIHEEWYKMKEKTDIILLESVNDLKKAGYLPAYPLDFKNMLVGDMNLEAKIRIKYKNQ